MLHRYVLALALLITCSAAFSQQSESNGLELKLEQFQQQPSNTANNELQLDLNQFEQQKAGEELELNLNQFDQNKPADSNVEDPANKKPEVNLEQFNQGDNPSQSGQSLDTNSNSNNSSTETEEPGLGKMNNKGSAATRIDDSDSAELSDDAYLLRAGLWFLAIAIPIFLFIRARTRKRRRQRQRQRQHQPSQTRRRPTYDESDHR